MSHIRTRRRLTAHFKISRTEHRVIISPSRKQDIKHWILIEKVDGKIVRRTKVNQKAAAIIESIMYGHKTMVYS
jgi:hypothetical protein